MVLGLCHLSTIDTCFRVQVATTHTLGGGLPQSNGGWSALLLASEVGHANIVRALLQQRLPKADLDGILEATSAEVTQENPLGTRKMACLEVPQLHRLALLHC